MSAPVFSDHILDTALSLTPNQAYLVLATLAPRIGVTGIQPDDFDAAVDSARRFTGEGVADVA